MKKFIILLLLISFCASPQQSENIPITTNATQFQEVTTTFVTTTTLSVLEKEIPMYYNNWLDKNNHFDLVYKELKEYVRS